MSLTRALSLVLAVSLTGCLPAGYGAAAILRPLRLPRFDVSIPAHREVEVRANGVTLRGWLFEPVQAPARGLIVYLHGKDNNRRLGVQLAKRFLPQGYAVLSYDQRAHGDSTGKFCTYGVREKRDLQRVLDEIGIGPVFLIGHSLGAAVSLQAAAVDPRIRAVVAIASFSELEEIVRDRAPSFASEPAIQAVLAETERQAKFHVRQASPLLASRDLKIPVLLIHGTRDAFTSPEHSKRLMAALPPGLPRELLLVEGAGHESVLDYPEVWSAATMWIHRHDPGRF